jgi:sugar lactone lactonase YvrE
MYSLVSFVCVAVNRVICGEGCLYDVRIQVLYWLDNSGGVLFRLEYSSNTQKRIEVGKTLGCFALTEQLDRVLLAGVVRHKIQLQQKESLWHVS